MRKILTIVAASTLIGLIGSPTMMANADVAVGKSALKAAAQNFSPIEKPEKVACFGWGHCRPGWHQVCNRFRCWCVRC